MPIWFLAIACTSAPTPPDVDTAPVDAPEPAPAVVAPRRLTVAQVRRAIDTLAGVAVADGSAWLEEPLRRGYAGQQETAAIPQLLVDQLDAASRSAGDAWAANLQGPLHLQAHNLDVAGPDACELPDVLGGAPFLLWWLNAPLTHPLRVDALGVYDLRLRATMRYSQLGPAFPSLQATVDGAPVASWDLDLAGPTWLTARVQLTAGEHELRLTLPQGLTPLEVAQVQIVHGYCAEGNAIGLAEVEVRGPRALDCWPEDPSQAAACAGPLLTQAARRAWRSEPSDAATARLSSLVTAAMEDGDTFAQGLAEGLRAILLSPRFLTQHEPQGPRSLSSWEVASRLALLLWGSLPDDELLDCAAADGLTSVDGACGLLAQTTRMLNDPRAQGFITDFTDGWLGLSQLGPEDIPENTPRGLLDAMRKETVDVFGALVDDDTLPAVSVFDMPFTIVDPTLAAWYNTSPGRGPTPPGRRGLIGHASILTHTSEPTRTSAVRRGVFVLDRLRCDRPGDPPAMVPALDVSQSVAPADLAAQLAQHRADPACAVCHDEIDPPGLSMEVFGQLGQIRSTGFTPPPLPSGDAGYDALVDWLRDSPDVDRCLLAHLATHALGREVKLTDPALPAWSDAATAQGGSWRDMIAAVVSSRAFRELGAP